MRCTYCFKRTGSILYKDRYFCTEECRLKTVKYQECLERNTKRYLTGAFAPLLLLIPGFIFIDYMFIFIFLMLFIMGIVLIVYPFTTPQTIDMMGVKKSMRFARICGYGMILMGAVFSVILYYLTWIR